MKTLLTACMALALTVASAQTVLYEDFSNGFDGSTPWGAWTFEDNGSTDIWMMATEASPAGEFSTNLTGLESATADNGWVIFDAGLYNTPISNGIDDVWGFLYSPVLDLSGLESVMVEWQSFFRYCCFDDSPLSLEVSNDGGETWVVFAAHGDFEPSANSASENGASIVVDVSCAAAEQSNVQLRWGFNRDDVSGYSHYFWGIDDVTVYENPLVHNLEVLNVFNADLSNGWEFAETPLDLAPSVEQGGLVVGTEYRNNGLENQTGVTVQVEILDNEGTVLHTISSGAFSVPSYGNQATCPPQLSDTLYLNTGWVPPAAGDYVIRSTISADVFPDELPVDNVRIKPIAYSDYVYAHDDPSDLNWEMRPGSFNGINLDPTGYGSFFTTPNPSAEVLGLHVAHGPNTTPGVSFRIVLYQTFDWDPYNLEIANELSSTTHTVDAEDIPESYADASYVFYPYQIPVFMEASLPGAAPEHVYFAAVIRDDSNQEELTVMANREADTDGSSQMYSANGAGLIQWFPNTDVPAVRMVVGDGTDSVGCTNPEACNYDEEANIDSNDCCLGICGCNSPYATNYNALASCNDGSCLYQVSGVVFNDLNADGDQDPDEYPLPFQEVNIPLLGISLITNDDGEFFAEVPEGVFQVFLSGNDAFPYVTTPDPHTIYTFNEETLEIAFGFSIDEPDFEICIDFYPSGGTFLCNDLTLHNICYRNTGNVPIDGIIEVEFDPLFQGFEAVTPVDSTDNNIVYLSFENLQPGEMFFDDILLLTPTVDFIGEFVTSTVRISGFYEDNQVAYGEAELTMEVACAYDPNDKQVFPNGYTEDHLVLNDGELEYLIRFQNTGNAPAQTVLLRDTLDLNLDLSSFELVANSHSVMTTLNAETREVTFLFENIQLPDSTCCEEDSHGLVSFKIRPFPDLPAGTELNNTAYIYFDNNEPIVTNTTWTTIHACKDVLELEPVIAVGCGTNTVEVTSNYNHYLDWNQTYTWTLNGDVLGEDLNLDLASELPLQGWLNFTAENPLCVEEGTFYLDFHPQVYSDTCTGDLDCDQAVGSSDILTFLGEFGCADYNCMYDLDGDGTASISDLLMVLGNFAGECE